MATGSGGPQPTDSNNLATAYSNACANLAAALANPQPSYSENGRSMSWNEYVRMLQDAVSASKTSLLAALQTANGPFEICERKRG